MTEESGKAYQETHLLPEKETTVSEAPADDPVNHPAHYTDGIEVIDYIESKNFCYHIEELESETMELRQEEKKRQELNQAVDDALYGIKSTDKLTPEMEERFLEAVYVYGPGKIEILYRLDDMIMRELGM